MVLSRDVVSNFIGGVSQQTDKLVYPNQSKELINCLLDPIEGLKKRPPSNYLTRLNDALDIYPYIHTIIKEDEKYQVIFTGNGIKVFDLDGNEKDVYLKNKALSYITTEKPLEDLYAVTIADYTFVLNKKIRTQLKDTVFTDDYKNSAIIFVQQGDYGVSYKINIDGTEIASIKAHDTEVSKIKTDYLAGQLHTQLVEKLSTDDWEAQLVGSTIILKNLKNNAFKIQTSDGNGNRNLYSFYKETSSLNDLPVVAPNGFILKIIGDDINVADDYYVKFKTADNSDIGTGAWIECCQPEIKYQLDPYTMPYALRREADGTFTLDIIEWADRKAGDEDTAPTPSFVGNTIQEVLTYKGRLGFISGDRSCYSDVMDIFSFFKRSVLTELDSDPIDVGSNSKMVYLKHSLPFNEGLMLLSTTSQFTLKGGDLFTNSTVSLDLSTEYQCSENCKPITVGANGFFVFENGAYTRVMSLYVTQSYTNDAIDITEQVPSYIPSKVFKIAGSRANNVLVALTEKEPDALYIYNSYYNGENRVQSAWHKWKFKDAKLLNVEFDKHILYVTIQYEDGIYLESIDFTPQLKEEGLSYQFYLDRKLYCEDITYQEEENISTLKLPYKILNPENLKVINTEGFIKSFKISEDNQTLILKGKHTKLIIGYTYLTFWKLPKIYVRQQTQTGGLKVKEGILMLKDINLTYADSGYFKVNVNSRYTTQMSSSYKFTGIICGKDTATIGKTPVESGTFLIPVISNTEDVEITIESDSFLPCCFLSLEWLGDFSYRGK